jgi:hypothetical protein
LRIILYRKSLFQLLILHAIIYRRQTMLLLHALEEVDLQLSVKDRLVKGEDDYYNYLGGRYNALIYFARKGNLEMVQWIVQKLGKSVAEQDSEGMTVLLHAAQLYKLEIVQWLIQYGGANIDDLGQEGDRLTIWNILWLVNLNLSSRVIVLVKIMLAHGPPDDVFVYQHALSEPLKLLLKQSVEVRSRFRTDSTWRHVRIKEIEESDCERHLVPDLMKLVLGYAYPSEEDAWDSLTQECPAEAYSKPLPTSICCKAVRLIRKNVFSKSG